MRGSHLDGVDAGDAMHASTFVTEGQAVALVIGQTANACVCRSATRWAGAIGWRGNRLLVGAVLVELAVTAAFIFVPPVASALGHAPPTAAGWVVALLAAPAVLAMDAVEKHHRTRR